ncbi:MAG: hypothetical protein U0441_14230 [Polyangiaceae bacterium]
MGRATGTPPKRKVIDLNEPCPTCKTPKRILCIRSNRTIKPYPHHWGHANMALVEIGPSGKTTTTYGNWPAKYTPEGGSTLKKDFDHDKNEQYPYARCKEITEEQYKKFQQNTAKADQSWNFYNNNCSTWAGSTWKDVTGEGLYYGQWDPTFYDAPSTLGTSIQGANGGYDTNFSGNF